MGLSPTQAAPAVFDAVAEAVEPCAGDGSEDPEPFCATCGSAIGVFLKLGLEWRHYTGTDLTDIVLFEPGHQPVLACLAEDGRAWLLAVNGLCRDAITNRLEPYMF